MIRVVAVALALWPSLASADEKWSCSYQHNGEGKALSQEWIVSGDKMFGPKGYGRAKVVVNNGDTLAAFLRFPNNTGSDYTVIDKRTGFYVEVNDVLGVTSDPIGQPQLPLDPDLWVPHMFEIGHCLRTDLIQPQRPGK
jgi:hypothetical protein